MDTEDGFITVNNNRKSDLNKKQYNLRNNKNYQQHPNINRQFYEFLKESKNAKYYNPTNLFNSIG